MSDRMEEARKRRAVIDDIGEVVGALRAIAAARSTEAQGALAAISAYEKHVTSSLGQLAAPAPKPAKEGSGLVIVVGASQGFCGGYPARVAEATLNPDRQDVGLVVIGQRTTLMLAEAGVTPLWNADLPAATQFVPALASAVTDAVLELGESHPGPIMALSGSEQPGLPVTRWQLWPPEQPEMAAPPVTGARPLTTLPRAQLLKGLLAESLFAEIARTILQGLRVENRARVEAMSRAQTNLKTRRTEVEQDYRQARQEQMTTEVIELSMGQLSSHDQGP